MIKDALYNKMKYVKECPRCEGYSDVDYGENEHGCGYCNGNGYVETDEYDRVDFEHNNLWAKTWNKEYCQAINSDLIQSFFDDDGNVITDINKDEETVMKINENTKVTLTIGQLKKLVKESIHIRDNATAERELKKMVELGIFKNIDQAGRWCDRTEDAIFSVIEKHLPIKPPYKDFGGVSTDMIIVFARAILKNYMPQNDESRQAD